MPTISMLKLGAVALVIVAIIAALGVIRHKAYTAGAASVQAKWDVSKAEMARAHAEEVARLESIARKVEVRYMYRDRWLEGQTKTILREVPVYVTPEDDERCDIPDGFMLVRHAAIEGHVPDDYDPRDFVGAADPIALSDLSANDVENYGSCHRNANKLIELQSLVRAFQER